MNFIEVSLDNISQPGAALKPAFAMKNYTEAYLRLFDSSLENQQLGIHFDEFPKGASLFRFELTSKPKKGNIRISLRFAEALPEGVSMILYSKFQSQFEITDTRNVIEQ